MTMKNTNYIEQVMKRRFPDMKSYEDFVFEFKSEAFSGKHAPSVQRLLPYGNGLWVTCRLVHKEDIPNTSLHLPDNVTHTVPSTIVVASLQNKFTRDVNKHATDPDELLLSEGDLLVVSYAGCVTLPGDDDLVFVNIQNVIASVDEHQIDFWYYEDNRDS